MVLSPSRCAETVKGEGGVRKPLRARDLVAVAIRRPAGRVLCSTCTALQRLGSHDQQRHRGLERRDSGF